MFIDSEKTRHFKLNLNFVRFLTFCFVIYLILSIFSIFYLYLIYSKQKKQENYIVKFKNDILNYHLAMNKELINNPSKEIVNKNIYKDEKNDEKDKFKVHVLENPGIKFENIKTTQEIEKIKISFSLLNTNSTDKIISGNVCLVIQGENEKKDKVLIKIPENLKTNIENLPQNCEGGEQVKFSKLRPTEFNIKINKKDFLLMKYYIIFSYQNKDGIVYSSH